MALFWGVTLAIYGLSVGFNQIEPLFWWLLVPMLAQDAYDNIMRIK